MGDKRKGMHAAIMHYSCRRMRPRQARQDRDILSGEQLVKFPGDRSWGSRLSFLGANFRHRMFLLPLTSEIGISIDDSFYIGLRFGYTSSCCRRCRCRFWVFSSTVYFSFFNSSLFSSAYLRDKFNGGCFCLIVRRLDNVPARFLLSPSCTSTAQQLRNFPHPSPSARRVARPHSTRSST